MFGSFKQITCIVGISLSLALTGCTSTTQTQNPTLTYWTPQSQVAKDFVTYVNEVTDPKSGKFIPKEDRIAVFDMDGTLVGETYPSYFDWVMFTEKVLRDPNYKAPADMKKFAAQLEEGWKNGKLPKDAEKIHAKYSFESFKGMTIEEVKDYAREFMKTDAKGFNNLKRGDAYFRPMISLVKYLEQKDFTIYIVSGTERNIVRVLLENVLDVPSDRIIGSDGVIKASGQGSKDGLDYVYQPDDKLIYTGELITKNVKMNKVPIIAREIGKVPVLSFGNSSGDLSMSQYITNNKKYESRAYILLGDDSQREHGSEAKVEKLKKYCEDHGFYTISMKNDFATVYGDNVTLQK
ncbi:HAD family hydrolase [uncultured Succinivibrio sp.]|uniref:HAD family hydrolase n=1 Tax=uncultured Succinivibrio sp. TaxID=540749 RepID=UPI0025F85DEA|nr:HAD family hydrolase [uncultured Succinivibrio sp.]